MRAAIAVVVGCFLLQAPSVARAEGKLLRNPQLIPEKSRPFRYSQDALAHHAQGVAQVRCELSDTGKPHDCRVLSGLAHIKDEELVEFAEGLQFSPAMNKDGAAVALADFRFPVRVVPPSMPAMPNLRF